MAPLSESAYDRYSQGWLCNNSPDARMSVLHDFSRSLPDYPSNDYTELSGANIYEEIPYSNIRLAIDKNSDMDPDSQIAEVVNDRTASLELKEKRQILESTNVTKGTEHLIPTQQCHNQQIQSASGSSESDGYMPVFLKGLKEPMAHIRIPYCDSSQKRYISCPDVRQTASKKVALAQILMKISTPSLSMSASPPHITTYSTADKSTAPVRLPDMADFAVEPESTNYDKRSESSAEYKAVVSTLSMDSEDSSEYYKLTLSSLLNDDDSDSLHGYKLEESSLSM